MRRPRQVSGVTTVTDGYRQVGSFESDAPSAVGVGSEAIAFGLGDRITVVSGRERATIDHGDPIVDLAIADRLLVLSPETLTAYSLDGDAVWSHDAGDAYAVAGTEAKECCGVLDADTIRFVEVGSGREQFAVDRTRPGSPDDDFIATPTGFAIATWSFLTAIDGDGEIAFDRDLSAVVRSVGTCDGTIVAALQSDRLVGLDRGSGEDRWRTELDARQVAPVGEESLLVSAADGILAVAADGTTDTVPDLPTGDVYATGDGTVVCSVRGGTIATYVPDRDRIDVEVLTDSVGVGGTIDVEASNPTETERTIEVALEVEGCSLSPAERTLTIDGESTAVTDFPVASVQQEGRATVTVAVDGTESASGSVEVEDAASGGLAVETALRPTAIDDGVAEIAVTVENVGGVPLDAVRLLEVGTEATDVEPGETWEGTVTRPYEPDRRVSVGLEIQRGDRRREYAPTCRLPPLPAITATVERDALRATVELADAVPVSDRLVVEMPGAGRVRSPVTIDGDELLLLVPQYESGVARIALDSLDTEERVRVPGNGTFTTPSSTSPSDAGRSRSSRNTEGSSRSRTESETHSSESPATRAGETESSSPQTPTQTESSGAGRSSDPQSASSTDRPTETTRVEGTETAHDESADTARSESTRSSNTDHSPTHTQSSGQSDGTPSVSATRSVPDRAPGVGHAIRDRLTVENGDAPVESVTVVVDDGAGVDLGRMDRGESVSLARFVAAGDDGDLELPAVTVEADGSVVDEIPPERLPVDDGVGVLATVSPADGTLTAEVTNGTDQWFGVTGIDPGPEGGRETLSTAVESGASVPLSTTISKRPKPGDAVPVSVWIETETEDERRIDVLAAADDGAPDGDAPGDPDLAPEISPDTQVAGEYSSVVLAFENRGTQPLTDVSVVADGGPIDSMFYSPARRERVDPGDRIEHYVDLESGHTEPSFEVTVSYVIEGTQQEYLARASGPAVDDEAAWTDDHLAAWSLERVDAGDASPVVPARISTPLQTDD